MKSAQVTKCYFTQKKSFRSYLRDKYAMFLSLLIYINIDSSTITDNYNRSKYNNTQLAEKRKTIISVIPTNKVDVTTL